MYANQADPESLGFPHEALSYDANSVGLFQQRAEWWGTCAQRMDPYQSALLFFKSLKRYPYNTDANSPGAWAQRVQGSAFPDRYDQHIVEAQALYDRLTGNGVDNMGASENGWQPAWVDQNSLVWVTVPGTEVNLQMLKGQPAKILAALAADFNAYIEPLRDADSASYTPTNSVSTSNHLNGTAMDLNWDSHAFHVKGTFNSRQIKTIRDILSFYENTVFWAGDWNDPIDEMHWQMAYASFGNPNNDSFIKRKIRADGFSTFVRGPILAPAPPPVVPVKPPVSELDALTALVARLSAALALLLQMIEKDHPETLSNYIKATTKG